MRWQGGIWEKRRSPDQRRAPGAVVGNAQPFARGLKAESELGLGDIDTGKVIIPPFRGEAMHTLQTGARKHRFIANKQIAHCLLDR